MKNCSHTSGFTLVELLVSVMLLAIVVSITISTFLQFTQKRMEIQIEQQLYENARFVMEKLVKEVRENTIDYEEYWNKSMTGGSEFTWYGNRSSDADKLADENNFYFCSSRPGSNAEVFLPSSTSREQKHSYYQLGPSNDPSLWDAALCLGSAQHKQLYGQLELLHWNYGDPDQPGNPVSQQDNEELGYVKFGSAAVLYPLLTLPRWVSHAEVANSAFDQYTGNFFNNVAAHLKQNELYLISGDKSRRLLLRLRPNQTCSPTGPFPSPCPDSSYQVQLLDFLEDKAYLATGEAWVPQLDGEIQQLELLGLDYGLDTNKDQIDLDGTQYDGQVDTWACDPEYDCTGGRSTADNLNPYAGSHFVPTSADMGFKAITSADISVKELSFYINPINDPNLAWAENNPLVQNHPQVRIVLTVIPGYDLRRRLHGPVPEVTLVTTVSSRVY